MICAVSTIVTSCAYERVSYQQPCHFSGENLGLMNQHRAHFIQFKSRNCFKVLRVPWSANHLQQGRAFLTFHLAYAANKWGLLQLFSLSTNVRTQKKEHWTRSREAKAPAPALAVTISSCYFLVCEIKALSLKSTIGSFILTVLGLFLLQTLSKENRKHTLL